MGLDLTLCPERHVRKDKAFPLEWFLAYNRLATDRDGLLTPQVQGLKANRLPKDIRFDWYDDEGIKGDVQTDPYGDPLTYVTAEQFKKIDTRKMHTWNKAVVRFIRSLAPNTPVVLWWH